MFFRWSKLFTGNINDKRVKEFMTHSPEDLVNHIVDAHRDLERDSVLLKSEGDSQNAKRINGSRIGGSPALYYGEALPSAKTTGAPLIFLFQANLAEMPKLDFLPETGLLQIFVANGDLYGCPEIPSIGGIYREGGGDFLVRHIPQDAKIEMGQRPTGTEMAGEVPFSSRIPLSLTAEARPMIPPISCEEGEVASAYISSLKEALFSHDHRHIDTLHHRFAIIERDQMDGAAYWLGGHPSFIQSDVRHDARLAKMVPLATFTSSAPLMWGDGGTANFFVDPEKSKVGDFSEVAFTWDSH